MMKSVNNIGRGIFAWAFLFASSFMFSVMAETTVNIRTSEVLQQKDLSHLLGGNIGLWYKQPELDQIVEQNRFEDWKPGLLRMPGGSWSDEIYWNGNGVRDGNNFDLSKRIDKGYSWQVDYSKVSPQFRITKGGELSDFHGCIDVLSAHEFIQARGATGMVTVNAGTGTPEMAAEWVRWANKEKGFNVKYWEIGNELEGDWELGHFRPDGSRMTAELYAEIYIEFAKAMKAVDPTIKVGGPTAANEAAVFAEKLIETSGDLLDFVSFHTYPVGGGATTPKQIFAGANGVGETVDRIRGWIQKYQPDRVNDIEIGITEWHVQVHEDRKTANLVSGLWCAKFIGRMLESGVDFANIWDMFSTFNEEPGEKIIGGHGLFDRSDNLTPRGPFWAMTLWSQDMGGSLVKSDVSGQAGVTAFATKRGDNLSLLLINENEHDIAKVKLSRDGKTVVGSFAASEFSYGNYLWNDLTKKAEWSTAPRSLTITSGEDGVIELPGFSATVVHLDKSPLASVEKMINPKAGLIAPKVNPANQPFSIWLTLKSSGKPYIGNPIKGTIKLDGPIKLLGPNQLTLHGPARRIELQPTGVGKAEVLFEVEGSSNRQTIDLVKVEEREAVIWNFDSSTEVKSMNSSFPTKLNEEARRNEKVAEVLFAGKIDEANNKNRILEFNPVPENIEKEHVGGVRFEYKGNNLASEDPKAQVQIILQSNANHWIRLDHIPLKDIGKQWNTHLSRITQKDILETMPDLYSLILLIKSNQPVTGSLYLDDVGFIYIEK